MGQFTVLDVINRSMGALGEQPVTDPNSAHPTAVAVRSAMDVVLIELQSRNWWFNVDCDLYLQPDGDGKVPVPANATNIDPVDPSSKFVERAGFLYDKVNHTDVLDRQVQVNVRYSFPFDELPTIVQAVVMWRTVVAVMIDEQKTPAEVQVVQREKLVPAEVLLQNEDLQNADLNMRNRPLVQEATYLRAKGTGITSTNPNLPGG